MAAGTTVLKPVELLEYRSYEAKNLSPLGERGSTVIFALMHLKPSCPLFPLGRLAAANNLLRESSSTLVKNLVEGRNTCILFLILSP
jgi:hypothetical protein